MGCMNTSEEQVVSHASTKKNSSNNDTPREDGSQASVPPVAATKHDDELIILKKSNNNTTSRRHSTTTTTVTDGQQPCPTVANPLEAPPPQLYSHEDDTEMSQNSNNNNNNNNNNNGYTATLRPSAVLDLGAEIDTFSSNKEEEEEEEDDDDGTLGHDEDEHEREGMEFSSEQAFHGSEFDELEGQQPFSPVVPGPLLVPGAGLHGSVPPPGDEQYHPFILSLPSPSGGGGATTTSSAGIAIDELTRLFPSVFDESKSFSPRQLSESLSLPSLATAAAVPPVQQQHRLPAHDEETFIIFPAAKMDRRSISLESNYTVIPGIATTRLDAGFNQHLGSASYTSSCILGTDDSWVDSYYSSLGDGVPPPGAQAAQRLRRQLTTISASRSASPL